MYGEIKGQQCLLSIVIMGNQQGNRKSQNMKPHEGGRAFWQSQSESLHRLYVEEGKSTSEIAALYGCNKTTIQDALRTVGIKLRQIGSADRGNGIYRVNARFFNRIDSEVKAYLLGYILADGHVSQSNNLMFCLHEKDIDLLEKIRAVLNCNSPIRKKGRYRVLSIGSKYMCDVLRSYGFTNNKSMNLNMAQI